MPSVADLNNHRHSLLVPVLAGLGLLLVTLVLAAWHSGLHEAEQREQLRVEALSLAYALRAQGLSAALFQPGALDEAPSSLRELEQHLRRFAEFAGYQGVWTIAEINQRLLPGPAYERDTVTPPAETQADHMASPSILAAGAQRRQLMDVLHRGQARVTDVYPGPSGLVISALAPLRVQTPDHAFTLVVGVDLTAKAWRTPLLQAASAPLIPGGLLVLIFGLIAWYLNRTGIMARESQSHLRFLEPALAAMTGLVVTIASTSSTMQLEQHFTSHLLNATAARWAMKIDTSAQVTSNAEHQTDALRSLVKRLRQFSAHEQAIGMPLRIRLLQLEFDPNAPRVLLVQPPDDPIADLHEKPGLAPTQRPSLDRLAVFSGTTTLALELAPQPERFRHQPLNASWVTVLIGLILTSVATALVVWLRGRLGQLEGLLDQRTQTLRQREANFMAITNAVRDAIVMMDSQGQIIYWNPAAERIFGYREEEALGQDLHALITPAKAQQAYLHRGQRLFASQGTGPVMGRPLELDGLHQDGSSIPVEIALSALQLDQQWHALGVIRDISARKRTEQRLMKLNHCLAHLGADYRDNIHRITAVCGDILAADTAFYNRLEEDQLVTLGCWQAPEDLPLSTDPQGHICYDLIRGAAVKDQDEDDPKNSFFLSDLDQTPYLHSDPAVRAYGLKAYFGHVVRCGQQAVGSLCVLFTHQRSPSDEERRLLGILAAALSTEENRHQASLELERSQQRMSLATRTTGIGIWEYEPASCQLRLDSEMHILLNMQPVQATRPLEDWLLKLRPEDVSKLQDALQAALGENVELDDELCLLDPPAGPRYLRVLGSAHASSTRQRKTSILGVCYDITRSKAFETHLREAKDLAEQASRAKTHFLSQISHELRTPMNGVLGFAQLLAADTELTPDQQENVAEILHSGHHLLKLIDEVLDLVRIESGDIELHTESLPLAPLLEESLALIKPLAGEQQLHIDLAGSQTLSIRADAYRFKQILLNLLSNAVNYNQPEGLIRLEAVAIPASAATPDRVRVQVSDTGAGIPADQLGEIFEPFRRLPDTQVRSVVGSSVGLAVVKRLTRLMGGDIGVDSVPGEGSCFWFELPCPSPASSDAAQPPGV